MEQLLIHGEFSSQYHHLKDQIFTKDVTIVCHNGTIKAHRIVLASAVALLKPVLEEQSIIDSMIVFQDFDISFIRGWVIFLYTGTWLITREEQIVLHSFVEALKFNVPITYKEVTPEVEAHGRVAPTNGLMGAVKIGQSENSNDDIDPSNIDHTSTPQATTTLAANVQVFPEDTFLHIPPPATPKSKAVSNIIYKCDICNQVFLNPRDLKPHIDYYHPGVSVFQCEFCELTCVNVKSLQCHISHMHKQQSSKVVKPNGTVASSRSNKTQCQICDKPFTSFQRLTKHLQNCHSLTPQPKSVVENLHNKSTEKNSYRCSFSFCDATFTSLAAFNRHITDFAYSHVITDKTMTVPFTCPICSLVLDSKQILIYHILTHYTFSNAREKTQSPRKKKRKTVNDQHKCRTCSKTFHSNVNYKHHEKICLNKFPCHFCPKRFTLMGSLDKHMVDIHAQDHPQLNGATTSRSVKKTATKSLVSTVVQVDMRYNSELQKRTCFATGCQLAFPSYIDMKNHSKVHPATLHMQCEICGELFKNRVRVLAHRMQHFGRGLKCEICGKTMMTKQGLRSHLEKFHNINNANVIVIE